jgi:hypothetical protein
MLDFAGHAKKPHFRNGVLGMRDVLAHVCVLIQQCCSATNECEFAHSHNEELQKQATLGDFLLDLSLTMDLSAVDSHHRTSRQKTSVRSLIITSITIPFSSQGSQCVKCHVKALHAEIDYGRHGTKQDYHSLFQRGRHYCRWERRSE